MDEADTRRPRLDDAPEAVRAAVADMLGGPVVAEHPADGGFTPSIASVVETRGGRRLFVKAAPVGAGLGEAVQAGVTLAEVTADLGPRLVGHATVGAWRIAAYEVVEGEPVTRWEAADLPRLAGILRRMRELFDPSPLRGTTPYARAFVPLLGAWNEPDLPALPVDAPREVLAELESRWLDALADGTALHHGDLRRDNVLRRRDGRLLIVDWTHLWTAPRWTDAVRLGPDVAACGHDPERLLRACWPDAPADGVNVALAGLAGRGWRDGHLPGPPALRRMQREQGLHALRWLASRLVSGG
ncbi:phosphotransferase [Actinoplanes sp. URMC 104]|uniref:phosphotransferase n=1 Tax=Actinoplanes sp. URMC 104 TaxID=3423409 RepID=UPI003F1BD917